MSLLAQVKNADKKGDPIMNIQFHYTYISPQKDLALRFGTIHNAGFGGLLKTANNWLYGADASYQFGSTVKDYSFLANLTNSYGNVMNNAGQTATYNIGMRGFNFFGKVGKVFPLTWRNPNSGIILQLGAGMYFHKINISTTRNDIPTLTEELKKGYDRLSSGPAVSQFVGYYYHSSNRYYNFFIGVDFMQAFTTSVRKFNYDTMLPDTEKRFDMTVGGRIGWMIPIYLKAKNGANEYEFR